MLRTIVSLSLLIPLLAAAPATQPTMQPDPQLAAKLDPILHALDKQGAVCAARVIDLANGRELYALNADRPVMPASNGKLANVAAGLDHFGADHRFVTSLAMDGDDDLWLIGTGDPGAGDEDIAKQHHETTTTMLDEWSKALVGRGVKEVKGKLYYYDGVFEDQWVHPTWSKSYLTDWYAAPVPGLTFNDNCIDVTIFPGPAAGAPARFEVTPPMDALVNIVNEVKTGAGGEASISRDPASDVFTLNGAVNAKTKLESKPVTDPGAFFAEALRTNLRKHGITIVGESVRATRELAHQKWPLLTDKPLTEPPVADSRIVAAHVTTMAEVMARIDKNSQNLFAEAMCKMQGRDWNLAHGKDEPGSWAAGGEAVHDFLRRSGIDDSAYVLADGSGLSRDNRVTARLITDLLRVMTKHRDAEAFRASLSVSGKDGTIRKRMTDIPGAIRAKTGSIGGVRSLSGYATTRDGRTLAFSIIFNAAGKHEKKCEELADDTCRVLVGAPVVTTRPSGN